MEALECILSWHSYRGSYLPEPVPRADLIRIMEAGLAAPSGCNLQTASVMAVDDPELVRRIRDVIDPPGRGGHIRRYVKGADHDLTKKQPRGDPVSHRSLKGSIRFGRGALRSVAGRTAGL